MFLAQTDRKYDEAVRVLNSLQPLPEVLQTRLLDDTRNKYEDLIFMQDFMDRTAISHEDINKLGVIHISGTKGKGSTSAYCENILRQQGYKTGFYSSPHLMEVRERFRINGKPLSKEKFCQMFWFVYNQLLKTKDAYNGVMPRFFCFCTLLACHIFKEEQVDAFIMEVGIGGEYDQTNIVQQPLVCGVTSLDIDHTNVLGFTIESIAWHKAGIFKKNTPTVTSPQIEKAMEVLIARSKERQCLLYAAAPLAEEYDNLLTIFGPKQRINAGLAVQICKLWSLRHNCLHYSLDDLEVTGETLHGVSVLQPSRLEPAEKTGLSDCKWYGRNQIVYRPGITYYLDGAHTNDSMEQCAAWYKSVSQNEENAIKGRVVKIILLNVTGDRDLPGLISHLKPCTFDAAVFTPNKRYVDLNKNKADEFELSNNDTMKQLQSKACKQTWDDICSNKHVTNGDNNHKCKHSGHISFYFPCITDAMMWITQGKDENVTRMGEVEHGELPAVPTALQNANHLQVLVTGSLHLVGGVLLQISPGLND